MHKNILLVILFLLVPYAFGQQGQFFDAPFGGGIGYVPAWYIPNISSVNDQLVQIDMPEYSTSGFYSSGIAGFIYIGFVKNLRIGGMGFGGCMSTSQSVSGVNREAVYSLGGGGVTIEYTLPFIKNMGLSVGGIIGGGNLDLDFYRNSEDYTWAGTWEELSNESNQSQNFNRRLTNSFWLFTPTINFDYPLFRFVTIRIGAGYQFTFGDEWTADNDQSVAGIPSDLNGNSFFIQSGIFVGFFSF